MINIAALKNIRVVLTSPSHPGNVGAAARALKTMGLGELHLVNPRYFPHAEADARAAGAIDVLREARVHASLSAALSGCVLSVATSSRQRELPHPLLDARAAACELVAAAAAGPVAFVFGNETSGLSNEEAGLCQLWAYVPANPEYPSLNLACAVQVFAYEARMACASAGSPQDARFTPAGFEQIEHLHRHFEQTLAHTGFHDPTNPKKLLQRLRRMLARTRLETEEVDLLQGFLKAVDKMRR